MMPSHARNRVSFCFSRGVVVMRWHLNCVRSRNCSSKSIVLLIYLKIHLIMKQLHSLEERVEIAFAIAKNSKTNRHASVDILPSSAGLKSTQTCIESCQKSVSGKLEHDWQFGVRTGTCTIVKRGKIWRNKSEGGDWRRRGGVSSVTAASLNREIWNTGYIVGSSMISGD